MKAVLIGTKERPTIELIPETEQEIAYLESFDSNYLSCWKSGFTAETNIAFLRPRVAGA